MVRTPGSESRHARADPLSPSTGMLGSQFRLAEVFHNCGKSCGKT